MNLYSLAYFPFLIAIWLLSFFLVSHSRLRLAALLMASYLFYASWSPAFLLLLLGSSLFNFAWGRLLRRHPAASILWPGVLVNIGLLVAFRFAVSFVALVGISFYTFQAISYLVDVYRGYQERPSLTEFLLYMAFWPYILAGPICRLPEMLPQFRRSARPSRQDLQVGSARLLAGLFMKIVIADTLARGVQAGQGVTAGFDQASGWGAWDVWILALGFGFQVFFDFAGYSHMAIGSARLFGIRLRENFNNPYLARTPAEFWSRWHMSLSSWIRDYVFFPLASLRRSLSWRHLALVLSMTIFGLWHGLTGTLLLWGVYQGLLLLIHRQLQQILSGRFPGLRPQDSGLRTFYWPLTFIPVSLGWILFRANSLDQALLMFQTLLAPEAYTRRVLDTDLYFLVALVACGYFCYVGLGEMLSRLQAYAPVERFVWLTSPVYRATIILWVIIWSEEASPFVYVRF
ncbi:MAG: MBOAT family O-acyltransferase [Acidobacteriota bacterium]